MMKNLFLLLLIILIFTFSPSKSLEAHNDLQIFCDGGAILVEFKTSKVLFEQDADKRWPPASIVKIMTAIIALEKGDLRDNVIFSKNAVKQPNSRVGLKEGMSVPLYSLIEAMLIKSGNDAAVAIAEHIAGSEKEFVKLMNEKARLIGMTNTNFANASGLPDDNQYSTARDLARLAIYAMGREDFRNMVCKREVEFVNEDGNGKVVLQSTNRLLGQHPLVDGIKSGYTIKSKHCLAASASFRDYRLIAIVLGTDKDKICVETSKLLDWGFAHRDPLYNVYREFEAPTSLISDDTSMED